MFFFQERKEYNANLMRRGNIFTTDKAYIVRIESISSKFEYIAGENKDKNIYLRCKDCGYIFKYSKSGIRPSHRSLIICRQCQEILSNKRKEEDRRVKILAREEKAALRMMALNRRREEARQHICARCGKEFTANPNKRYCSELCRRRAQDSRNEHRRRIRIKGYKDNIQLPVLYKRDKGICWLCEDKCEWNDFKIKNGAFVVGERYPSIDHVIPLSKGGSHTWSNVRLAHKGCNTYKRDCVVIDYSLQKEK